MNAQDDAGGTDVSEQPEPNEQAVEETPISESTSFQDALLKMAEQGGHEIGDKPVSDEPEAISEEPTEEEKPEEEAEGIPEGTDSEEEEESKEELKPAAKEHPSIEDQIAAAQAKGEKPPWYLKRIAEEADKKRRALEEAGTSRLEVQKRDQQIANLQAQLSKAVSPQPTEDNPFIDVNDINQLAKLERSYEKAIELAEDNPDGAVDVVVGVKDGQELRRDFTPEELVVMRRKADKAIRKFIPERRTYLQQRASADAQALEIYPEFRDPESDFTKVAAVVAQKIMTGQAAKDPELLVAIGDYAKGYLARISQNGKPTVKTPEARRIVESSKVKVAPTPVRSRSVPERKSSVSLEKAAKKLEQEGTQEAALEWLNARDSRKSGSSKRVESISE